jgi:hypothetical protein
MDNALAIDRALRAVNVSWSVGIAIGMIVRMVVRATATATAAGLFGSGHGGRSVRVTRVNMWFQVVLREAIFVVVLFLLVLVQLGLLQERPLIVAFVVVVVFGIGSNAACAAVINRDSNVVDS